MEIKFSQWAKSRGEENLKATASMKVKPGMRLSMAVASVAELKYIPAYPNICANILNKHSKSSQSKPNKATKIHSNKIKPTKWIEVAYPNRPSKKNPQRIGQVSGGLSDLTNYVIKEFGTQEEKQFLFNNSAWDAMKSREPVKEERRREKNEGSKGIGVKDKDETGHAIWHGCFA